ncbi:MAG: gamma-aminobutyraldehyde dehydrogenase [Mycobacteriaceae bacterium]
MPASLVSPLPNFINGTFVQAQGVRTLDVISPVDESVVAVSPVSEGADIDAAVSAAKTAFLSWRRTTPSTRAQALLRLADAIEVHSDRIVEAQSRNTGQLKAMIASEEVSVSADQVRFFAGAARLLEGKSAGEYMEGFTSSLRREPVGIVGQVTPWNYPFMMAIWKICPAIAAGNTVVLKPSDTTPESTLILAELSQGIFPDGVFNVVLGDAETGATLVQHPDIAMVSITGSVRAGVAVAASAAQQLKRAHLELGGKAPAVIFDDVDISKTAAALSEAAYFNAGQDCTAVTRVLVHESIHDQLVTELVSKAGQLKPGLPDDPDAFYGPLNNINHFNKVSEVIATLPDHATVVAGGHRVGDSGYYFAPTVITGVKQQDHVVQEEIFGPVITVQSFSSEQEAIALANDVKFALASSVWTNNHARAQRFSIDLDFGCVWINCHIPLVAEMPHGGFKYSGYGKDLSAYGVEDYTRIKHVMSSLAGDGIA